MGLKNSIDNICFYNSPITFELLEQVTRDLFSSALEYKPYVWYAINTVKYSTGKNLLELRRNKDAAKRNSQIIKRIQGFKPKLKRFTK